ncbi:MAG TPA: LysR family transcriptional regulator [Candidatus Dormibacteraeota bacterium]|nr:LysR family transcriptional regulator [Candidatus Dormibacteraeota bacterium]
MELRQLRYFIALSEELHFTRAAERLHFSQPPLTRQIRQLEEELGVELLHRTSRRVELTDAGRAFANEARQIMARVAHAADLAAQANRGLVGHLVLGYTPARTNIVARAVKTFTNLYPHVRISLRDVIGHNIQLIRDGRVDVGFIALPNNTAGLVVETLLHEQFVVAMPAKHPLALRRSISIRELAGEPNLLFPRHVNPFGYDMVLGLCQKYKMTLNIVLEIENLHMRMELVTAGFGLAVVCDSAAQPLHGNGVIFRRLQNSPTVECGIAYSPENRSHALQLFTDCVKQKFLST